MEKLTDFEIGFVCGLLDAEGSICMRRHWNIRKMEDGTQLLFYYPKIHINMNHKKTMDYLDKILKKTDLTYSYYGPDNQKRYVISIQAMASVERFWDFFNFFKRLKFYERYIGCILDESN